MTRMKCAQKRGLAHERSMAEARPLTSGPPGAAASSPGPFNAGLLYGASSLRQWPAGPGPSQAPLRTSAEAHLPISHGPGQVPGFMHSCHVAPDGSSPGFRLVSSAASSSTQRPVVTGVRQHLYSSRRRQHTLKYPAEVGHVPKGISIQTWFAEKTAYSEVPGRSRTRAQRNLDSNMVRGEYSIL